MIDSTHEFVENALQSMVASELAELTPNVLTKIKLKWAAHAHCH